jgi:hypothetical protein
MSTAARNLPRIVFMRVPPVQTFWMLAYRGMLLPSCDFRPSIFRVHVTIV